MTAVDGGWVVYNLPDCQNCAKDQLQDGDVITKIGDLSYEANVFLAPFYGYSEGDLLDLDVYRSGSAYHVSFQMPETTPTQRLAKLLIFLFWLPFWLCSSWLAYFASDSRSILMSLMFSIYSVWMSAGLDSSAFVVGSSVAVHVTTWLLVPLTAHVHWTSPYPFRSLGRQWLALLYGLFGLLAVAEIFQEMPRQVFSIGTVLMVVIPILLLAAHQDKAFLNAKRLMSLGVVTLTVPLVTWLFISFASTSVGNAEVSAVSFILVGGAALLALPVFPVLYVYANYRQYLPALVEQRVWRVLVMLVYISLMMVAITAAISVAGATFLLDDDAVSLSLITSTVIAIAVALGTSSAQSWMKRFTYGNFEKNIARASEELSFQMTELAEAEQLEQFLSSRIHPILGVYYSAFYLVGSELTLRFVTGGVSAPDKLRANDMLISTLGKYQAKGHRSLPWVRLSLPLLVQQELVGVWLLGARENDDFYSASHIQQLQSLANQVAAVVEMRRQQREIERQVVTIVAKEKEAALGRVVTSVAHQFRNPLQVIMGALEADNNYERPDKEWLELAYERARMLADVVRSIQRFAQVDSDNPQVLVDVEAAIDEALLLISHLLKERGIVVRKTAEHNIFVHLGASDLTQVILNLLENASDAQQSGEIVIDAQGRGNTVLISVRDVGQGIPEGELDRVFEPLFSTKQGLGLGLWIARSIIERGSGTIDVSSERGRGSTFTIKLPKAT